MFKNSNEESLRELKRIMKIELKENPERWTYNVPDPENRQAMRDQKALDAYTNAKAEGPILPMTQDRTAEVKILREKLDAYMPKLREQLSGKKSVGNNKEAMSLIDEIELMESQLNQQMSQDGTTIPEDIRGRAAGITASLVGDSTKDAPLAPIHLRYIARQLKQILIARQHVEPNQIN